jgi:hypothetical protein
VILVTVGQQPVSREESQRPVGSRQEGHAIPGLKVEKSQGPVSAALSQEAAGGMHGGRCDVSIHASAGGHPLPGEQFVLSQRGFTREKPLSIGQKRHTLVDETSGSKGVNGFQGSRAQNRQTMLQAAHR